MEKMMSMKVKYRDGGAQGRVVSSIKTGIAGLDTRFSVVNRGAFAKRNNLHGISCVDRKTCDA